VRFTCTSFEEVIVGESFLERCAVEDDTGAYLYLDAQPNLSNDGLFHSNVTGINCVTNGGQQWCPNGGTFEFRVHGINDWVPPPDFIMSSIDVTVSAANAQDVTHTYSFAVDPSCTGFGC
jgi:hypothetical protein